MATMVAVVAALVAIAPLPADAATFPTWGFTASEVGTWVDGIGRLQAAWVSHLPAAGGQDVWELLTARHTLAGQPDATWGTDPRSGAAGVRRTALDAPPGAVPTNDVAALGTDAAGNITIAWSTLTTVENGEGCEDDVFIDETVIDRYTSNGSRTSRNAVAHHQYTGCNQPSTFVYSTAIVPLSDGSIAVQELTEVNFTPSSSRVQWFGPAGDTRATFSISVADPTFSSVQLVAASTVGDGRLYITTTDGLLRRASASGVDRSIPSSCRFGQAWEGPLLPVAGPGGSFAAVCGSGDHPETGTVGLQVRRYDPAGALSSTVTSTVSASNPEVSQPTSGVFDSTGRLWVGGPACMVLNGTIRCYRSAGLSLGVVSAFDATHKVDSSVGEADQVDGVRSVGNGRVSFAMPATADNGGNRVSVGLLPTPAAPIARAGPDQTVGSGQAFTLDGSTSTGDNPRYQWVQIAGPTTAIQNPNAASTTVTGKPGPTTMTFRLTVTDSLGRSSTDDVTVTVRSPK